MDGRQQRRVEVFTAFGDKKLRFEDTTLPLIGDYYAQFMLEMVRVNFGNVILYTLADEIPCCDIRYYGDKVRSNSKASACEM
mgnify:FL=1